MGLLDRIRNLITGQKPKRLTQTTSLNNNADLDRTMPFITIDAVVGLISNPEIFERFENFEKNEHFFQGLTKEFIASRVKEYYDFMSDKGEVFGRKEIRHIRYIESFLPKEEKEAHSTYKQYTGINKTELYNTAANIISDNEAFKEFLAHQRTGKDMNGIPVTVLADYISTEMYDFARKIAPSSQMEKNIDFVKSKERAKDNTYRMNPDFRINPDFENSVYDAIRPTNDPVDYALQLYNELNKRVKYNPAFFALDQDLTDEFAKNIYYMPIDQVSPEKNSLICKQWAELYAYMLEKSGFEAYVCGKGKHKNVKAFIGTTVIEADATNQTHSSDDPSRLTDLTRSKLGVRPAGFKAFDYFDDKKAGKDISTITLDYDIADFSHNKGANDQLTEIMNMIDDDRDLSDLIMGLNDPKSEVGTILKKVSFISDMLKGANLDNMDSVGYMSHLFHNTLRDQEFSRAKLTNAFFKNLYTNDCDMVPIISINTAKDMSHTRQSDYMYFEFDQKTHEIKPITREKLVERVISGELIQGRGKEDRVTVPGIPEMTNRAFIEDERRNLTERAQSREINQAVARTAQGLYSNKSDYETADTAPIPTVDDDGGR